MVGSPCTTASKPPMFILWVSVAWKGCPMTYLAVAAGLLAGFLTGLMTYRGSRRWCDRCGASLVCPDCLSILPKRAER
jgi:hypothetical protein